MALIVVMEDDAATRMLVSTVLKKDGHDVMGAEDGAAGLALVEGHSPDLVISDVQMPNLNGFQMLAAVRSNPAIAATPVILLTSMQDRAAMRVGMNTGADDYITKPFRPNELREAVAAQLNRSQMRMNLESMAIDAAVQSALQEQRHTLAKLYEERLATELSERWPSTADRSEEDEHFPSATVMFVDIPHYSGVAHRLSPQELTDLVKRFYGNANDTAHLFGAHHMQFIGEGLLAVFTDDANTRTVNRTLRAARAAMGLVESGHGIGKYLDQHYAGRQLPRFSVHVGIHSGAVTLAMLRDPLHGSVQQLPVGDAVGVAMQLQKQAQALGWPVAVSASTLRTVAGAVVPGRRAMVDLPDGDAPLDLVEMAGLAG